MDIVGDVPEWMAGLALFVGAIAGLVTAVRTGHINRAVNNRPPEDPTLYNLVKAVQDNQHMIIDDIHDIKLNRERDRHHDAQEREAERTRLNDRLADIDQKLQMAENWQNTHHEFPPNASTD